MSQPRRHSLIEAFMNTASGFLVSYAAGFFIFPLAGMPVTPSQNFQVVGFYTVISIVRSYFWRRAFNWHLTQGAKPPRHRPF